MTRREHWETVFETKDTTQVSWYRKLPQQSLELIRTYAQSKEDSILDVGAGDSNLPDFLLDDGFTNIYALDIAQEAIERSRKRLGERADDVTWLRSDILELELLEKIDVWHDRAVFHFLTTQQDQMGYKNRLSNHLSTGGICLLATFSEHGGPKKCSGLEVCRHDEASVSKLFAPEFSIKESFEELHETPSGSHQKFQWFVLEHNS